MKIAITGGAGFIGQRLSDQLAREGHEIVIIDAAHPENPIDVTDEAAMMGALRGVDVVYNLAAQHRDDVRPKQLYYDVNVGGAEILVKAAKAHNIKTMIFTSTVAVYGLDAGESKESDTPAPFNEYGKSKLQAEEVFNQWQSESDDHTLVTLRLVATFGKGNRGNVFTLIDQIARDRFVMVGKGGNAKSLAYVDNVSAFLAHCLTLKAGQAYLYNYADKPDLKTADLVSTIRTSLGKADKSVRIPYCVGLMGGYVFDQIAAISGRQLPISSVRVKKFCANTVVNSDKRAETGFKAPYSLEEGLQDMIAHDFADVVAKTQAKAA